jgi:hypothetical protein
LILSRLICILDGIIDLSCTHGQVFLRCTYMYCGVDWCRLCHGSFVHEVMKSFFHEGWWYHR